MIDKSIKIAIVGGGIAGFASGVSLIQNGYKNVTVYERDATSGQRRQGYGLTILQGITALKKLEVFNDVHDKDTPSRSHFIFDYQGNLVGFFGTIFWPAPPEPIVPSKNKKHNLHLSRQDLRNILLKKYLSIHPDKEQAIQWNKKLLTIKDLSPDEYVLDFNDNFTCTANLIIGSDGINSITRKFKYEDDSPLKYLGILLVLGISNTTHQLGNQRVFQTVDGNCRLFAMPFSKDDPTQNIMWQLSFPLDEPTARRYSQDTDALKEFLLEKCGNWHEPIPQMIRSTELDLLMGIPAFDRDLMPPQMDNKRIVLLGDAAHPMSPFKGQGANQALLDACDLTEFLNKNKDICSAIFEYETKMSKRVLSKVLASRERVTTYHQANILNVENFSNRGVDANLLEILRRQGVNAQTDSIEDVIIEEMKNLNLFNQTSAF